MQYDLFWQGLLLQAKQRGLPPQKHGPASRRPRPSAESAPLSQPLYCRSATYDFFKIGIQAPTYRLGSTGAPRRPPAPRFVPAGSTPRARKLKKNATALRKKKPPEGR
jgi:hypothetical protein